jgi:Uma2 family endonuclease
MYLDKQNVSRQAKQIRLRTQPDEKERSRKADIVVFEREEWQRMKTFSSSAAAYTLPSGAIEVVSTNWKDDYLTKLAEYEDLGILEYIIIDYAAFGGRSSLRHSQGRTGFSSLQKASRWARALLSAVKYCPRVAVQGAKYWG